MPTVLQSFRFTLLLAVIFTSKAEDSWTQFRGSRGDGVSASTGLPTQWSESEHVAWKTAIHGRAWSCPVILDGQIWITTATEDGQQLFAVCVDEKSGKIVHNRKLFTVEKPQFAHKFNTYASPTPVIEKGRVYVTFGSPGTACLDTATGELIWERRDLECNHYRGAGSSPIIYNNLLIMNFDGSDYQFLIALDKKTGKTVWRQNRSLDYKDLGPDGKPESEGDWRKAYATPHVAIIDGKPQLLSQGAKATYGYEPLTGKEIWQVEERTSHSAGTRPVLGDGLVFIPSGWSSGQIMAIKPGKSGEVIDANAATELATQLRIAWKSKRNVPKKPSLIYVNNLLFGIDDNGVATCWEPKTGESIWNERVGGNYSASPISADNKIYFSSEEGKVTVVQAGREFKKIAENQLGDGFMASPAVSGHALFLRSRTHLYRVEN